MNVKELAQYLKCSESCIRNMVRENKIPFFRINSKLNFKKDSIDLWVHNQEIFNANKENSFEPISIIQ